MPESALYQSLLESTLAIPWKINWETKAFEYIGPQVESILGWPSQSWKTANDWIERIHPEDRKLVVDFCISQSENGCDHEATYRALKADGGHVWIRDVVHVMREHESTVSLVGFMFKLTTRASFNISQQLLGMEFTNYKLTKSEKNIAELIAKGYTQKELSSTLSIKPDTVRKHLQAIYRKTSTKNQSQLITLMLGSPHTSVILLNN